MPLLMSNQTLQLDLNRIVHKMYDSLRRSGISIPCKKGCSYCCVMMAASEISVPITEALNIAGYLWAKKPHLIPGIVERLEARKRDREENPSRHTPCALLDLKDGDALGAGTCMAEHNRPGACLADHSLSLEDCKVEGGPHDHVAEVSLLVTAFQIEWSLELESKGVNVSIVDLFIILPMLLQNERDFREIERRWAAGKWAPPNEAILRRDEALAAIFRDILRRLKRKPEQELTHSGLRFKGTKPVEYAMGEFLDRARAGQPQGAQPQAKNVVPLSRLTSKMNR